MQKLAACSHSKDALPGQIPTRLCIHPAAPLCTRRSASVFCIPSRHPPLQPLTRFFLQHSIARRVLTPAHTSFLLHVIANQCAHWCGNPFSPQGNLASWHYFGQIRMHFPVFALGAALCFVLPQENGLPRRFAPRNDMLKTATRLRLQGTGAIRSPRRETWQAGTTSGKSVCTFPYSP